MANKEFSHLEKQHFKTLGVENPDPNTTYDFINLAQQRTQYWEGLLKDKSRETELEERRQAIRQARDYLSEQMVGRNQKKAHGESGSDEMKSASAHSAAFEDYKLRRDAYYGPGGAGEGLDLGNYFNSFFLFMLHYALNNPDLFGSFNGPELPGKTTEDFLGASKERGQSLSTEREKRREEILEKHAGDHLTLKREDPKDPKKITGFEFNERPDMTPEELQKVDKARQALFADLAKELGYDVKPPALDSTSHAPGI
jgi:hypothetical protein